MKKIMYIFIGAVLLVVALSFVLVYVNTHPPRYALSLPPSEYAVPCENVSFVTEDGVLLRGWLVKPERLLAKTPVIIICHGVGANKSDFTELAVSLASRGYMVLLFDFRAHGESEGSRTSLGYHEQKDIIAALGFLKNRSEIDIKRLGIYGFSMGGSAAILAAAHTNAFRAVVVDSAFTSLRDQAHDAITGFYHLPSFPFLPFAIMGYRLYFQTSVDSVSPVRVIAKIAPTPVLLIAGGGDLLISAENGRRLFSAAQEPKELWIIPHADHGGTLAAAGDAYEKRVGEFFDRNLK